MDRQATQHTTYHIQTLQQKPSQKSERIPLEIWLQIIERGLSRVDIQSLTLVTRYLKWIAQPLLFRQITITQLFRKQDVPAWYQKAAYYQRLLQRLELASSTRISHAVRSICILAADSDLDSYHPVVDSKQIIDTIFDALICFPNLKALRAEQVTFSSERVDQLAKCSHLEEFHLKGCTAGSGFNLSRFPVRRLTLDGELNGPFGWWIPLIRSKTLEYLFYGIPSNATDSPKEPKEMIFPAMATGPTMQQLRTLRIPAASLRFPCFAMALSRCSVLEELYVEPLTGAENQGTPTARQSVQLSPNTLSRLKAVHAPYHFITSCLAGRPIQYLSTSYLDTPALQIFARAVQPPDKPFAFTQVEELISRTTGPPPVLKALLQDACDLNIRRLYLKIELNAHDTVHGVYAYLLDKGIPCPRSLRSLRIFCYMKTTSRHGQSRDHKQEYIHARNIISNLRRRCPRLREIDVSVFGQYVSYNKSKTHGLSRWYGWTDEHVTSFPPRQ